MTEDKSWEQRREAMWLASKNKKFTRDKVIRKTVQENLTLEEFKEILINNSPNCLLCTPWSGKKPFIHITKMINPSDEGVTFYCESWEDKTPKFKTFEDLYGYLSWNGGLASYKF